MAAKCNSAVERVATSRSRDARDGGDALSVLHGAVEAPLRRRLLHGESVLQSNRRRRRGALRAYRPTTPAARGNAQLGVTARAAACVPALISDDSSVDFGSRR